MDVKLDTPLTAFPSVGEARTKKLEKLGLSNAGSLLAHYPRDYEDRRQVYTIQGAPLEGRVCISAMAAERPRLSILRRGLDLVSVKVVDGSGTLYLTFFNQSYVAQAIHSGEEYIFYGAVEARNNRRTMVNPIFERAGRQSVTGCIMPVYPLTAGISNHLLAALVRQALPCAGQLTETLPQHIRQRHQLAALEFSIKNIHFPRDEEALALARRRLTFEELFYLSVGLCFLKDRRDRGGAGHTIPPRPKADFLSLLPFSPTQAQSRVMDEVAADMASGKPMNRLVQGDVGSGKTAVAACAGWLCAGAGFQAALMAPTEVLAEQHFKSLSALLAPAGIRVGLLTGSLPPAEKKRTKAALAAGDIDFIVGTHALISAGVTFSRLALIVADEQHRFGVAQRAALAAKGATPGAPPQVGRRGSGEVRGNSLPPDANKITPGDPTAASRCGTAQRAALAAKGATPGAPPQVGRRGSGEVRGNSLPPDANKITPGDPTAASRCGAAQQAALAAKGEDLTPHVLVMSATPIPRTLALIIYGDLDVSVIDQLPPGRTPISTYVIREDKRQRMYQFVRRQVAEGRQVYIICPAVEDNPDLEGAGGLAGLKAVKSYTEALQKEVFPDLTVGLLHGKMRPKEKEAAMSAFSSGQTQILVSTTVVEVGVDVPNASLIIIENADRFGLSQLHQLRGRVGRGQHPSHCVLMTSTRSREAMERLHTLASTTDGFKISEEDLKVRGPGDFFGSRQHGLPQMKLADLAGDMRLLSETQEAARALLAQDPQLSAPENRPVLERVRQLFADTPDIFN